MITYFLAMTLNTIMSGYLPCYILGYCSVALASLSRVDKGCNHRQPCLRVEPNTVTDYCVDSQCKGHHHM